MSHIEYWYEGTSPEECCSVFGCGNKLSMTEKLFGNRCHLHKGSTRTNLIKTYVNAKVVKKLSGRVHTSKGAQGKGSKATS